MAKVIIDIPGIGEVEAKNVASEATLRELVKLMGGSAGNQGGGAGGAASSLAKSLAGAGKSSGSLTKAFGGLAKIPLALGKGLMIAATAAYKFTKFVADMTNQASAVLGSFADLDKSLTGAAAKIPLFGQTYARSVKATEELVNAFQAASSVGASFGGSILNLSNAAAQGGMTIDEYTRFVRQNANAFRLLGGSVETGRKRFESISKELRTSGLMTQLTALGYTSAEVNETAAKYIELVSMMGRQQNMSVQELAIRSANYAKEIDMLAKVTGETREQQMDAQKQLLADAQFQAKIDNMSVDSAKALMAFINGLEPAMRPIAKDIIATGSATTDLSRKFAATHGDSFRMMQEFAKITEKDGILTLQQQTNLDNMLRSEGNLNAARFRDIGRFSSDFAGLYNVMTVNSRMDEDRRMKAAADQAKQIKLSDEYVKTIETLRRRINETSIEFKNFLVSSGLLNGFMQAFETVTEVVRAIFMPIQKLGSAFARLFSAVINLFKPIATLVKNALNPLVDVLVPVVDFFTNMVNSIFPAVELGMLYVKKAFYSVSDWVSDTFRPIMDFFGRTFEGIAEWFNNNFVIPFQEVGLWFREKFVKFWQDSMQWIEESLGPLSDAFTWMYNHAIKPVAEGFQKMKNWMTDFIDSFSGFGDVLELFGIQFSKLGVAFDEFGLWVDKKTTFFENDEDRQRFAEKQAAIDEKNNEIKERSQKLATKMEETKNKVQSDRAIKELEILEARKKRDNELNTQIGNAQSQLWKAVTGKSLDIVEKNEQAKIDAQNKGGVDFANPYIALGYKAAKEDSYLIGDRGKGNIKSIEDQNAKDDAKKEAEEKAKKEQQSKNTGAGTNTGSSSATSSSAEGGSTLNSMMAQLVELNKLQLKAANRQIKVTAGLAGDLNIT